MFERFTDRARRVLVLAQEEARLLNHGFIGTEHILLGLIHEGEGVAAKALEALDISLEAVRARVDETIGPASSTPTGSPPFTPRAKKVLELSLREALQLGHNYIGTEHILLGLLREGEGVAAQVLVSLGADLNRVRQQVIQLLIGRHSDVASGDLPTATIAQLRRPRPGSRHGPNRQGVVRTGGAPGSATGRLRKRLRGAGRARPCLWRRHRRHGLSRDNTQLRGDERRPWVRGQCETPRGRRRDGGGASSLTSRPGRHVEHMGRDLDRGTEGGAVARSA